MKISSPKFRKVMTERGFSSLAKLAQAAGVHRNTIYPLVNAESSPFSDAYLSICRALRCSPLSLLSDECSEDDQVLSILSGLLSSDLMPHKKIAFFLYGSRAKGTNRKFSDYDLGITGGEDPVSSGDYLSIQEELLQQADNLPVILSLLNFDQAPLSFLQDFDSPLKLLCGDESSFSYIKGVIQSAKRFKKAS